MRTIEKEFKPSIKPEIDLRKFSKAIEQKNEKEIQRILNLIKEEIVDVWDGQISINDNSTKNKIIINYETFALWTVEDGDEDDYEDEYEDFCNEFTIDESGASVTTIPVEVTIIPTFDGIEIKMGFDYLPFVPLNERKYQRTDSSKVSEFFEWGYSQEKELIDVTIPAIQKDQLDTIIGFF